MALVFNGESIGVTDTGTDVTVPDHPKARLMYYLNCMYTVQIVHQPTVTSVPVSVTPMDSPLKTRAILNHLLLLTKVTKLFLMNLIIVNYK
jgi:hypothetical protein